MAPAKKTSATSLFTPDNLIAHSNGFLKAVEKRREGWDWWEFVCKFRDRTGVVSGGYSKKNKQILGLTIFGKGPAWSTVVSAATSLATNDEETACDVISKLGASQARGAQKREIEENGTTFQIVRFGDGQLLFKIRLVPPTSKKRVAITRAVAVALKAPPVKTVSKGRIRSTAVSRRFQTMGVELPAFKKRFNKWVAKQDEVQLSEQHSQRDALRFAFAKETCLMVFAGDGKAVSQLLIDGKTKEASEFWFCLEATIVALNPPISESALQEIMSALGKRRINALPKNDAEFDDGKIFYTYHRARAGCVLQIWPSRKARS